MQGLSHDREVNDWNTDYVVQKDLEPKGLRTYLHKYHLGYMPYYFKRDYSMMLEKLSDKKLPLDERYDLSLDMRKRIDMQKKQMIDNRFRMMMKVTMQITQSSMGMFKGISDDDYSAQYSGNHTAVFECELKAPP